MKKNWLQFPKMLGRYVFIYLILVGLIIPVSLWEVYVPGKFISVFDNTVFAANPTVTINQASGQTDPENTDGDELTATAVAANGNTATSRKVDVSSIKPVPSTVVASTTMIKGNAEPGVTLNFKDKDGNTITCDEGIVTADATTGEFTCTVASSTPISGGENIVVSATKSGEDSSDFLITVEKPPKAPIVEVTITDSISETAGLNLGAIKGRTNTEVGEAFEVLSKILKHYDKVF